MHRTIFSGGSIPSNNAHALKNRHGMSNFTGSQHYYSSIFENCPNFQPDDNKIPEPNHRNLRWRVANPGLSVLDSDHVHEVEDIFQGHETNHETDEIHYLGLGFHSQWKSVLKQLEIILRAMQYMTNLPNEVVESNDRTTDI